MGRSLLGLLIRHLVLSGDEAHNDTTGKGHLVHQCTFWSRLLEVPGFISFVKIKRIKSLLAVYLPGRLHTAAGQGSAWND